MFKLNLFSHNFQTVLKDITHVDIPDSTTSNLSPILHLISRCERVFFTQKRSSESKLVSGDDIDIAECLTTAQTILDITWEHINTGYWKDVDISWRFVYSYASLFKVLCLILEAKHDPREIVKVCDMGILMGAPILNNVLSTIATAIMPFGQNPTSSSESSHRKDRKKIKFDEENSAKLNKMVKEYRWLSTKEFETSFVKPKKPVLILDAIRQWPAFSSRKWRFVLTITYDKLICNVKKEHGYLWVQCQIETTTNERFKARYRVVPVEIGSKYTDENWTQKLMTMEEFIMNYVIKESDGKDIGYLAQHNLFSQIPELMDDIKWPMYIKALWNDDVEIDVNAWFGPAGTISPLHYDPKHNFLVQVMGEKYVKLYGKEESRFLYPRENTILSNTSQVDVESPDLDHFPLFKNAQCQECILRPGSMLYIPPECWHYVRSLSVSFSVSFWW